MTKKKSSKKKKKTKCYEITVPVHEWLINVITTAQSFHDEPCTFIGTDGKRISPSKLKIVVDKKTGKTFYDKNCIKVVTCKEVKDAKAKEFDETSRRATKKKSK
jgi:hypothetical protein